jgi:hypothetical protein
MGSHRRDHGSASIEMVAMVPLVALALTAVFYGIVAVITLKSTAEASRDAARVYSQTGDFAAAAQLARRTVVDVAEVQHVTAVAPHGIEVTVSVPGMPGLSAFTFEHRTVMP